MLVVDANILIRAVLGRRVKHLLETYAERGFRFFAPDEAFDDAHTYLPLLLQKRGKSDTDVASALRDIESLVEPVPREAYEHLENIARERLRGLDEEDWPLLAAALTLSCPIWTEDTDFFGTGVAQWTSDRVEIFLKAQTLAQDEPAPGK